MDKATTPRELETDWRSYAAGYQAAVFDLTERDEHPSLIPFIVMFVAYMLVMRYLIFRGDEK